MKFIDQIKKINKEKGIDHRNKDISKEISYFKNEIKELAASGKNYLDLKEYEVDFRSEVLKYFEKEGFGIDRHTSKAGPACCRLGIFWGKE